MAWRGAFRVDELAGERWVLALDLLRDGEQIVVADVVVSLGVPGVVAATARSAWSDVRLITKEAAAGDLRRAGSVLWQIARSSSEFCELVAGREAELEVVVDYSTGSILVASSRQGHAFWTDGTVLVTDD